MKLRTKLLIYFISIITIPTIIIYTSALYIFSSNVTQQMQQSANLAVQQTGNELNFYFEEARNLSLYPLMENSLIQYLKNDENNPQFLTWRTKASQVLYTMPFGISDGIRGISICKQDPSKLLNTGISVKISDEEIALADQAGRKPRWYYEEKDGIVYLYMMKTLAFLDSRSTCGYIKICLNTFRLQKSLASLEYSNTDFVLLDDTGKLILASGSDTGTNYSEKPELTSAESGQTVDSYYIYKYPISDTPFILCGITPLPSRGTMISTISSVLTVMVILTIVICLILAFTYTRIIITPLNRIGAGMDALSKGQFDVHIPVKGKNELALLTEKFNETAKKLNYLYRENYAGQVRLKQAQIKVLQTQFNPHFLYNTLDTVYWMCQMNESDKAGHIITNLTKMLRANLNDSLSTMTNVADELRSIDNYINIQKIRKGDSFRFCVECPDELLHCQTLRFILQPLIENALQHGLQSQTSGIVTVQVHRDEKNLIIDVCNDGKKINIEEIAGLIASPCDDLRGFSLHNIQERLVLQYGNQYPLQYYIQDELSIFRIIQPLQIQKCLQDKFTE